MSIYEAIGIGYPLIATTVFTVELIYFSVQGWATCTASFAVVRPRRAWTSNDPKVSGANCLRSSEGSQATPVWKVLAWTWSD